jgi:hypothetical protein
MSNLPRPHRLNIDLGAFKEPWISYCAARHITASAAFRQIVATLLNRERGEMAAPDSKTFAGKVRKQITMTSEEAAFVDNQAGAEGYSSTRWLIALLQARMGNGAQFGQYELEALGRSNLALLALGRNLNQIARSMNAGNSPPRDMVATLNRVDTTIQSHTKQVAEVIARNMERWNSK